MPAPEPFSETVELLRRAQAGEAACLGTVLERYRERLLVRIRLMLGSARHVAESSDFLQGVFVKILERFDAFEIRDEQAFLRWATCIARNRIRDEHCRQREVALESFARKTGYWRADGSGDGTPSAAVARAEEVAHLVDVLAQLDEDHRQIIELRHFEQLPFAEIAQRMQRSPNAVQLLHKRVLLRLGEILQGEDEPSA